MRVQAEVTVDEVDGVPTIVSSGLTVRGQVDGLGAEQFQQVVDEAAAPCPVSRLFAGANISIQAALADPGSAA